MPLLSGRSISVVVMASRDAASRLRAKAPANTLPAPDRPLKVRCHAIYRAHGRDQFHPRCSGGLCRALRDRPLRRGDTRCQPRRARGSRSPRRAPGAAGRGGRERPRAARERPGAHARRFRRRLRRHRRRRLGRARRAEPPGRHGPAPGPERGPQRIPVCRLPAARDQASADPGADRGARAPWQLRSAGALPAKARLGGMVGDDEPHRAAGRQRPRRSEGEGRTRRRGSLGDHRPEDLHFLGRQRFGGERLPPRARSHARGAGGHARHQHVHGAEGPARGGRHPRCTERAARRQPREEAGAPRRAHGGYVLRRGERLARRPRARRHGGDVHDDEHRPPRRRRAGHRACRSGLPARAGPCEGAPATPGGGADWEARAAFLTPIAKSYGASVGCRVADIGIEVHGGMGYIEQTGAARFLRDARITPIYEGTNGIQAIDLVGRKFADGGEAAFRLVDEIERGAEAARIMMPGAARAVWGAAETLRETTEWLLAEGMETRLGGATAYLDAFARVLGGHYHLAAAMVAARAEGGARRALAEIYIARVLPRAEADLVAAQAGTADPFALGVDEL